MGWDGQAGTSEVDRRVKRHKAESRRVDNTVVGHLLGDSSVVADSPEVESMKAGNLEVHNKMDVDRPAGYTTSNKNLEGYTAAGCTAMDTVLDSVVADNKERDIQVSDNTEKGIQV